MFQSHFYIAVSVCFLIASFISAQSPTDSGYIGYSLTSEGDPASVVYATNSTTPNVSTSIPEPDVFLNASVHVGEISLVVENITAKINLQADVLQLLSFKAGVTASIDRVSLLIQNVNANVLLEARLSNLVIMIGEVLDSLDLNPILATLGQDLTSIVNTTVGAVSGATNSVEARSLSYSLAHNILYSINDYSGRTHTNRVLAQNGSLVDQSLDNNGQVHNEKTVGYYASEMTFNGYNQTISDNSQADRQTEYVYEPYPGLSIVSAIFTNAAGEVVGTQVLSEIRGASSSVGGD